ncbi:MAG: shikimate dehydrogenase [Rickettsiales bacterium]|nr:shikimate dehydrogenase [Rickettsiales bacterium]
MRFKKELEEFRDKNNNKKICLIIGDPVQHSLSPAMHNSAYRSMAMENDFIYDKITVKQEDLEEFVFDLKDINKQTGSFVGLTCTMPHKQNIIKYLDELKEEARTIEAVNSVFYDGKNYIGYNTDWYGIERPFVERNIDLKYKNVAVIGAGGAARSAVYAFKKNDCKISIFNRTKEKADLLAREFDCNSFMLDNSNKIKQNDIIINTTSVGMGNLEGQSPIDVIILNREHIVFECIYNPKHTLLVKNAINANSTVIFGWEMLLYQGVRQFEIYTSKKPDIESMKSVL